MSFNRSSSPLISPDETSFDPRFFRKDQMLDHSTEGTSGSNNIGVFPDNMSHSSSVLLQSVLEDLDDAIGTAMSGGEVNTASNSNTSGIGIYKSKTLYDLEFKGIKSSDQHFTVSDEVADNTIDITSDASSSAGSSTLVARDGSGNFSAGTITANLSGNSSTATKLETARTVQITGDGTASGVSFDGSSNISLSLTVDKVDGKDVDDAQSSTQYLWTAGKIINYITGKINGLDWQESVKSKSSSTPPGSPSAGDRYIVSSGGTGAWLGQDDNIAEWSGTVWSFITPTEGGACWIEDEDKNYTYSGASWVTFGSTQNHNNMSGLQGGTSNQYYHLTSSQLTSLISPNCDVHNHDDRYYTESESDGRFLGISANAASATKLQTTRTISLTGDVSGSASFNGTANATITAVVANDSHTHDTRYYTESESDSRFVNISGDTMTGNVSWHTTGYGPIWDMNTDFASIKFYNTGDSDTNSRLEFNIGDNGNEDFLFTGTSGGTTTDLLRISPDGGQTGLKFRGNTVWHAGNDGSGSGLDADLVQGLGLNGIANNSANKIVRTDASGYLRTGWINTTSGNTTNTISDIYVNTNDGYIRKATPSVFKSKLGFDNNAEVHYTTSTSAPSGGSDGDVWYQV